MADLKARYMGIELKNPVVAGACDLTSNLDSIKKIEDAGAGALVLKSLFEEQIQLEKARFDEEMQQFDKEDEEAQDAEDVRRTLEAEMRIYAAYCARRCIAFEAFEAGFPRGRIMFSLLPLVRRCLPAPHRAPYSDLYLPK